MLQPVLKVGALIGAPFSFDVALAVAAESDPALGAAETCWTQLVDRARGSILRTQETADRERWVSMHRDLASHLGRQISPFERRALHAKIAHHAEQAAACVPQERRDRKYGFVALAAEQWTAARDLKPAAETHRAAAELAEELLAFDLAASHYQRAMNAFEQRANEDGMCIGERLGLAHCTYRLGRLHLLAGFTDDKLFQQALTVLEDTQARLRTRLYESDHSETSIPAPDVGEMSRELRRCSGLAAYVEFYMAEQARLNDSPQDTTAANLYCEALQHAEAAQGEGDSRWVLAAASARLADQLLEKAADLIVNPSSDRPLPGELEQVTRDVIFHAERALGLRGLNAVDERRLAEPRAWAYEVLGRVHQWLAGLPQVAQSYFTRMDATSLLVDDATDLTTDLGYALFSLSLIEEEELGSLSACLQRERERDAAIVDSQSSPSTEATHAGGRGASAAGRLYRCLRWAEATRTPEHRAAAHACVALAWFAAARGDPTNANEWGPAHYHASKAADLANEHSMARQRILLLAGFVTDLSDEPEAAIGHYSKALPKIAAVTADVGRRAAVGRLLLELPAIGLIMAERLFGHDEVRDDGVREGVKRARRFCQRVTAPSPDTSLDTQVWELAQARLPAHLLRHSEAVRSTCEEIAGHCLADAPEPARAVAIRDLTLAAGIHDWLSDVDPARLLVLTREWDLPMSGVEWANPILLHGRLAVEVVRTLYDGEARLGRERFDRIERMVLNHTVGSRDASLLEKIFVIADWRCRRPNAHDMELPTSATDVDETYRRVFMRKQEEVRREGGLLSPDTIALLEAAEEADSATTAATG
jgi:HD superfamily phosphohydrolase YqeK